MVKIVEVLILLCIVSSSIAVFISKPCASNVYAVHHAEDLTNVRDTCLCPKPNNGYRVADLLNKQSSDLERVVVFYYRDKTNNEVYMYTPSTDKQLAIPEQQYEAEDDLEKIDSQISLQLFDNNPAKASLQTYQYPNRDRHRYHQHQHTKHRVGHLSKVDHISPHSWYHRQRDTRPDEWKSNDEVGNDDDLYPYVPYNPRDKKKLGITKNKIHSHNKHVFGNNADYAQANENSYDFNTWFSQSVIHFPEIYSGDLKYITFTDLREQLLRIFNEHGYSVINSQVLDPQGEAVESSNYKLVRVKIKQEYDEKHLSSEVDGIMFIKLVPMTILGVVPLTNNIEETATELRESRTESPEVYDEQIGGKDYTNTEAKSDTGTNVTQVLGTKKPMTNETSDTTSTSEQKPLDVLLKNLVQAVDRLVPHRRESNADTPGYRIIGGSAATGSGAPISSKGRSGTPH